MNNIDFAVTKPLLYSSLKDGMEVGCDNLVVVKGFSFVFKELFKRKSYLLIYQRMYSFNLSSLPYLDG